MLCYIWSEQLEVDDTMLGAGKESFNNVKSVTW